MGKAENRRQVSDPEGRAGDRFRNVLVRGFQAPPFIVLRSGNINGLTGFRLTILRRRRRSGASENRSTRAAARLRPALNIIANDFAVAGPPAGIPATVLDVRLH